MTAVSSAPRITPDEYLVLPEHDRFELVDGRLIAVNTSKVSSWVGGELFGRLSEWAAFANLGFARPADNLYRCFPSDPDRIRRPDVSFIARGRIDWDGPDEEMISIAPDLVAEVLSPNDVAYEIDRKVEEHLVAGVRLVWVVHPALRMVLVHRIDGTITALTRHDDRSGEDVVPEFVCRVSPQFPPTTLTPPANPAPGNHS